MEDPTTIQLEKKTVERLKTAKVVPEETYESLVNRLLDKFYEDAINDTAAGSW